MRTARADIVEWRATAIVPVVDCDTCVSFAPVLVAGATVEITARFDTDNLIVISDFPSLRTYQANDFTARLGTLVIGPSSGRVLMTLANDSLQLNVVDIAEQPFLPDVHIQTYAWALLGSPGMLPTLELPTALPAYDAAAFDMDYALAGGSSGVFAFEFRNSTVDVRSTMPVPMPGAVVPILATVLVLNARSALRGAPGPRHREGELV
ncbi:MAG: hypothetical protein AB7O21_06095 [Gammaproteobacteria bacterium]